MENKMRIVMFADMIFKRELSYKDACKVLEGVNKSGWAKEYAFSIRNISGEEGWDLVGHSLEDEKEFLKNPEEFILEIDINGQE